MHTRSLIAPDSLAWQCPSCLDLTLLWSSCCLSCLDLTLLCPHAAGTRDQALHPYCSALFHECRATIGIVNIRGEDAFYVNESFARTFFDQASANSMYTTRQLPVPVILSLPIHRDEKARFDRAIKRIMLEPRAACNETTQIYKVGEAAGWRPGLRVEGGVC